MPEITETLLQDVTEHTRSLNNVFRGLNGLGFKVSVSTRYDSLFTNGAEFLIVRVWREEDILRTEDPNSERASIQP